MLVSRLQVDVHNLSDLDRHEIIRHLINDGSTTCSIIQYQIKRRGVSSALDVQSQPTNIVARSGYDVHEPSVEDFLYKNMTATTVSHGCQSRDDPEGAV